jgi:hypothetical protein
MSDRLVRDVAFELWCMALMDPEGMVVFVE